MAFSLRRESSGRQLPGFPALPSQSDISRCRCRFLRRTAPRPYKSHPSLAIRRPGTILAGIPDCPWCARLFLLQTPAAGRQTERRMPPPCSRQSATGEEPSPSFSLNNLLDRILKLKKPSLASKDQTRRDTVSDSGLLRTVGGEQTMRWKVFCRPIRWL